jgi:Arc/MetJ family transcription regulator
MRTLVAIDDALLEEVLRATGLDFRQEAVELGLRTLLRLRRQEAVRLYRGKLGWEGDLDRMRTGR